MMRALFAACLLAALLMTGEAYAVRPDEMLADPQLEARAEQVGRELRCLVCRNQSIEDSEADLAHDLRLLVRRRIVEGETDSQVVAYIRSRYGDYVLLRPPFAIGTIMLWAGPGLILLLGAATLFRFYRGRDGNIRVAPLSAEEERRLSSLVGEPAEQTPSP